jgi:hypothetical protein
MNSPVAAICTMRFREHRFSVPNNGLHIEVEGMHPVGEDGHLDDSLREIFHCCPFSGSGTSFVSPARYPIFELKIATLAIRRSKALTPIHR